MPRSAADRRGRQHRPQPAAPLREMLVGCDGSDGSMAAAVFALRLCGTTAGRVTLLHAVPSGGGGERGWPPWRARLERMARESGAGGSVQWRIAQGAAGDALLAAADADARRADAILVGFRGGGGLLASLAGRTTQQLLVQARCPVMVFPDSADGPADGVLPRTVIVGVDGSREARHALRTAEALAIALSAKLTLLHAHNPLLSVAATAGVEAERALLEEAQRTVRAERATVAQTLGAVEAEVVRGDPRWQLVAAAARQPPSLLVVGSRGRGGFSSLLLGSTAVWVATHAPCPVLVVRPGARDGGSADAGAE